MSSKQNSKILHPRIITTNPTPKEAAISTLEESSRKNDGKSQENSPPTLFVKFTCRKDAYEFLRKIKTVRSNKDYENFQVDKMIPPSLKDDYEIASEKAFQLRKKDQMITRVDIEKMEIVLKAKTKNESKFSYLKYK